MLDYTSVLKKLDGTQPEKCQSDSPTNLLCLNIPDKYLSSDIKLMVFGQETNDWDGEYRGVDKFNSVADRADWLKGIYDGFFTSKYCFSYGGQFWNGVSKLVNSIEDQTGKTVGLLWNNIVKIGKNGDKGRPEDSIIDWQKPALDFIIDEIKTAQPDIVIFFTGPNYDDLLQVVFEDITFNSISTRSTRELSIVTSDSLPLRSIRTYHPNFLWRNGFDGYLDDILAVVLPKN